MVHEIAGWLCPLGVLLLVGSFMMLFMPPPDDTPEESRDDRWAIGGIIGSTVLIVVTGTILVAA